MLSYKWRRELRDKFGIAAEIGSADNLLAALTDMRARPDGTGFAWICTYTGLRPFRRDLTQGEEDESLASNRGKLFRELQNWSSEDPFFDLAIFDEAHYVRNPASTTSKLGAAISNAARALLLVTATPVNNANTDLLTLLRLLDADFFDSEAVFDALLEENRPAVQAANHLSARPPTIAEATNALTLLLRSSFVGKSELLTQTIARLERLGQSDVVGLLDIQEQVDQLNVLGSYISRTRRVQVKERKPKRSPLILPVRFSLQEITFYRAVTALVRRRVAQAGAQFSAFHLMLPQQRMASCIPAVIEAMRSGQFGDPQEILTESLNIDDSGDEHVEDELQPSELATLLQYNYEANDSKYKQLIDLLRKKLPAHEKVIIFAYFKGTLRYLFRRLVDDGIGCAMIHGDVENEDRRVEIERFEAEPGVRILLSSEVGSEGIDLQFCRIVVNYDLPWNPMRVEQRIGRIDRVGQQADRLSIVHLKVKDTIEERLYDRLHAKLGLFENSIGDLEAVLGEEIQKLTVELLSRDLTREEEEERIELTRRAVEKKLRLMQQLENEGESLLALSDLIASRIEQSRELGRYVTKDELQKYITDLFARNFKGCVLEWDVPASHCFRLELTFEAEDRFADFIRSWRLQSVWQTYGRKFVGTLDPETATQMTALRSPVHPVFVNHLSPLVRWITAENKSNTTAFYSLSALNVIYNDIPAGTYVYRVERWTFSGIRSKEILAYTAQHIPSELTIEDNQAEAFLQVALKSGQTWSYPTFNSESVLNALESVRERMAVRSGQMLERFISENDNLRNIKLTQINNHFDRRRRADEQRLETARARRRAPSFILILEGNISRLKEREAERTHQLDVQSKIRESFHEVACGVILVRNDKS
jgi:superfamily II DNA or RNA helicase